MTQYKAGGEVDAMCTKCKMLLAHTILAVDPQRGIPARVKCNTCHTDRTYRSPDGTPRARKEPAEPARPGRAGLVRESDFDRLMKNRDFSNNVRYSAKTLLALETIVDHPQFGLGLVTAIKDGNKAEILFRDGPRTLVHGRG
jgi:hypothetical protein